MSDTKLSNSFDNCLSYEYCWGYTVNGTGQHWAEITLRQHRPRPSQCFVLIKQSDSSGCSSSELVIRYNGNPRRQTLDAVVARRLQLHLRHETT